MSVLAEPNVTVALPFAPVFAPFDVDIGVFSPASSIFQMAKDSGGLTSVETRPLVFRTALQPQGGVQSCPAGSDIMVRAVEPGGKRTSHQQYERRNTP
ncbi:uncharacterized protein SPSK_00948 [Sporothrix schenckii 1099-18]|uniref:Uncharacterized protein n=1 Tax=Sporothrix schenckii 1099-18 TaxID=1397361 RepID=A0A0F2LW49_SPOSC|nr:uncharacterized protein SPSK_00948 [Sporothrix schenckii 1099-18]KJR81683.1 hypothetical protein SPSK_00948 [Sporothrix schenckii 1099-18]